MLALAAAGAAEGLWLRAETQTAGRGRMGRDWRSPPGNLYASTLVRVKQGDPPAPSLTFVAAVALLDTCAGYAPGLTLKWPNDILANGAKLAGILLERAGGAVVIGFGANLAHHPVDTGRAVTSIAALTGIAPDPQRVVAALAECLDAWLVRWRQTGPGPVLDYWQAVAHPAGTPLSVALPDGELVEGCYQGLDVDGALRLRLADGAVRVIHAGDVFLI
jgi:BirA family transcriptional regulator, biotin operon repressor / biotin---[acetyl-CoA-carboxylase] ligase